MIHQLDAAASGAPARPALRGPANGAPGPAAPLRPSDHPATPAPEQPLMLNGSARRCRQVELQVIWCRPVSGVGRAQSADGAILVPRWRDSHD